MFTLNTTVVRLIVYLHPNGVVRVCWEPSNRRSGVLDGAGHCRCEGRDAENGRLLNISKDVTSFHTLDDKGGAASEHARKDGRAMRARKGAVGVQLLWARASGHISTRETGPRCLGGSPPFEVTCLQRISCIPMRRPPQKRSKKTDMQYSQEPPDSNCRNLVRWCTDDECGWSR